MPTKEEEKKDTQAIPDYQIEHDWRISTMERRFKQLDKFLRDAQLVLYGIALGLILAEILDV